jgi:bifunctional DNA-binding transcriptional regulator/antitoxin component of YhaV-PrlF toxin-antitoxin module
MPPVGNYGWLTTGRHFRKIRNSYFLTLTMTVAKLTSKNQLTLPKAVVERVGRADYFEVAFSAGKIVLTPLRIGGADAVREKLAKLHLRESDIEDAITWARKEHS